MDFSLTEEQAMLADSVARFIEADYDFETRQAIAASDDGFSRDMWQSFCELGWTAVMFAEEDGGLDGGGTEQMLMMEHFGRGLVVEPFLANVILAGGILKRAAAPASGIFKVHIQQQQALVEAALDITSEASKVKKPEKTKRT